MLGLSFSFLHGRQQQLEVPGFRIQKADYDLFSSDLAESIEDLADGVVGRNKETGRVAGLGLFRSAPRLGIFQVEMCQIRDPFGELGIQELWKLLEQVQHLQGQGEQQT